MKYRVTIFKDCHAAHNVRFCNQSRLEADSIVRLAKRCHYLVTMREEQQ